MKKILNVFCLILGFALFFGGMTPFSACTKTKNTIVYRDTTIIQYSDTSNKQTYILLTLLGEPVNSTTPVNAGGIPLFNINNYVGVDSIVLVSNPAVFSGSGSVVLRLYDQTDNKFIGGSTITCNTASPGGGQYGPYIQSANFADSLPAKPVNLALMTNASDAGTAAAFGQAYLILYRK